jgi:hypothetical protein
VRDFLLSFNNREIVTAVLLAVFAVWALSHKEIRGSVAQALRALAAPQLLLPLLSFAAYVALALFGLTKLGWWTPAIAKDTMFWAFGTGLVLFFKANKAADDPAFFRKTAFDCLKVTVVVQFVFTNYVLPLLAELVLVPFSAFLGILLAVAQTKKVFAPLAKLLSTLFTALTLGLLANSFWLIANQAGDLRKITTYQSLTIGPILTLVSLPAIYLFALLMEYQAQFIRLEIWLRERPDLVKPARFAILRTCLLSLARLRRLVGPFYVELAMAANAKEIRAAVLRASEASVLCHEPAPPCEGITQKTY